MNDDGSNPRIDIQLSDLAALIMEFKMPPHLGGQYQSGTVITGTVSCVELKTDL